MHPYPRYSGPFEGSIISGWLHRPSFKISTDFEKNYLYFVTFTHPVTQSCGKWTWNERETFDKNNPVFDVIASNVKLYGPASLTTREIVYPCEHQMCIIHCPCKLCTSLVKPCESFCARSPCDQCDQQCKEHTIDLERNYNRNSDSFSIPFYCDDLTEENISLPDICS